MAIVLQLKYISKRFTDSLNSFCNAVLFESGSARDTQREAGKQHREGETTNKEWVTGTYSLWEKSGKWEKT